MTFDDDEEYDSSQDDLFDPEDDDPPGCLYPDRCLCLEWHHHISECFTASDCIPPPELPLLYRFFLCPMCGGLGCEDCAYTRWRKWNGALYSWWTYRASPVLKPFSRCRCCWRLDRFLWHSVGNHSECLPF